MRNYIPYLGLGFALIILAIFYSYSFNQNGPLVFFDPLESSEAVSELPVLKIFLTLVTMIVGILFGILHDQLQNRTTINSYRRELVRAVRSVRFFRAMLAAPIVFVGIYLAARNQPDPVVSLIFAFENGFFCDAVLKSARQESVTRET